ncbi:MAG: hypothetical protein ACFB4I_25075 [Cyanophyceae cyanobacterium]
MVVYEDPRPAKVVADTLRERQTVPEKPRDMLPRGAVEPFEVTFPTVFASFQSSV